MRRNWLPFRQHTLTYMHKLNTLHQPTKLFGSIAHLQRDASHSVLTDQDITHFESIIDNSAKNAIITPSLQDLSSYNTDWLNKYVGQSQLVLKPKTTQEVSAILSYCNQRNLPIHTQAGNTSLVGGGVPVFDEIILNTSRMNSILSFDQISGILTVEAGAILQETDNYLRLISDTVYPAIPKDIKHKIPHIFPLDLGAKGTCQIGGNISTNAGGLRLVRYGSLHGSVLGLEVVTADGTVLDLLSECRKDNTGYDLKQLFIGSEGQLGVITKAVVLCPKWCPSTNLLFASVNSFEDVLKINEMARTDLNEILSAIEFLDDCSISQPLQYLKHANVKYPLAERSNFYVLIETQGSNFDHDRDKLDLFIEKLMESNLIDDGVIAEDMTQFEAIWKLREGVNPGMTEAGKKCYKYDVSLPLKHLYDSVNECKARLADRGLEIMGYGHLGDGNIHINIAVSEYTDELEQAIEPWIFEYVSSLKGSISAEHGIGIMKPQFLHFAKDG
eukprot:8080_1